MMDRTIPDRAIKGQEGSISKGEGRRLIVMNRCRQSMRWTKSVPWKRSSSQVSLTPVHLLGSRNLGHENPQSTKDNKAR
jgi:hypothetical protein